MRALQPLVATTEKRAYRVEAAQEASLILRAYAAARAATDAHAHAAMPTFLAGARYPAARLVAGRDGAGVVQAGQQVRPRPLDARVGLGRDVPRDTDGDGVHGNSPSCGATISPTGSIPDRPRPRVATAAPAV